MDKQDLESLDLEVEFLNLWDQQEEQALTLVNEGKANYWHLDWDRNYEQELHFKDDSNCFIKLGFLLQPDLTVSYFGGLSQHLFIDLPLITPKDRAYYQKLSSTLSTVPASREHNESGYSCKELVSYHADIVDNRVNLHLDYMFFTAITGPCSDFYELYDMHVALGCLTRIFPDQWTFENSKNCILNADGEELRQDKIDTLCASEDTSILEEQLRYIQYPISDLIPTGQEPDLLQYVLSFAFQGKYPPLGLSCAPIAMDSASDLSDNDDGVELESQINSALDSVNKKEEEELGYISVSPNEKNKQVVVYRLSDEIIVGGLNGEYNGLTLSEFLHKQPRAKHIYRDKTTGRFTTKTPSWMLSREEQRKYIFAAKRRFDELPVPEYFKSTSDVIKLLQTLEPKQDFRDLEILPLSVSQDIAQTFLKVHKEFPELTLAISGIRYTRVAQLRYDKIKAQINDITEELGHDHELKQELLDLAKTRVNNNIWPKILRNQDLPLSSVLNTEEIECFLDDVEHKHKLGSAISNKLRSLKSINIASIVNNPELGDIFHTYLIRQTFADSIIGENFAKVIPLKLQQSLNKVPQLTQKPKQKPKTPEEKPTWLACMDNLSDAIWLSDPFIDKDNLEQEFRERTSVLLNYHECYKNGLTNIDWKEVTAASFILAHECGHALDRFFNQGHYTIGHRRNICTRFLAETHLYHRDLPAALKDWKSWDIDSSAKISIPEGQFDDDLAEFTANKFAEALLSPNPSEAAKTVMMAMKAEHFMLSLSKNILY